jgi:hypothetical protein
MMMDALHNKTPSCDNTPSKAIAMEEIFAVLKFPVAKVSSMTTAFLNDKVRLKRTNLLLLFFLNSNHSCWWRYL